MSELMCKDTEPAILRLDGIVTDPNTRWVIWNSNSGGKATRTCIETAKWHKIATYYRASRTDRNELCIPAMAPNGICTLLWVTCCFVAACMDNLEVINVTIRLIKVSVAIVV